MIYCALLKITFFFTSFSREASRWTGLSVIMNCLLISAFAPGLLLTGANCILRIIRRQVSLRTGLEKKHDLIFDIFCSVVFFSSSVQLTIMTHDWQHWAFTSAWLYCYVSRVEQWELLFRLTLLLFCFQLQKWCVIGTKLSLCIMSYVLHLKNQK